MAVRGVIPRAGKYPVTVRCSKCGEEFDSLMDVELHKDWHSEREAKEGGEGGETHEA
jgi:hypothetical protein